MKYLFLSLLVLTACTKTIDPSAPVDPAKKHRAELEDQVKLLRAHASDSPNDLTLALELSRSLIELARVASEPALKAEAEQAIARFAEGSKPDPDALVMRATIRQSRHDFSGAVEDLHAALQLSPKNAQAWVTLSVILGVRGEYESALKACGPLQSIANVLAFAACNASILGVSGRSNEARETMEKALGSPEQVTAAEKVWALVIYAEVLARVGDAPSAESAYQRALSAGVRDEYMLASYSDFLLDQQKYAEVVKLLEKEANVDPLLLRLAIAERALGASSAPSATKHTAMVSAVFAQNRSRGDVTHRREEARWLLESGGDPKEALRLATEDWAVQKEPWNVRLLLEAALAAHDRAGATPALEFIDKTKLEDVRILELAEKVKAMQ